MQKIRMQLDEGQLLKTAKNGNEGHDPKMAGPGYSACDEAPGATDQPCHDRSAIGVRQVHNVQRISELLGGGLWL